MQYGVEVVTYQRTEKLKGEEKKRKFEQMRNIVKLIFYFLCGFLVSRVMMVNLMAPFGIAFFISMALCEKRKPALVTGIGTLLGYISIYGNIKYLPSYCIVTVTLVTLNYILKNSTKVKKLILFFVITFLEFSAYKFFAINLSPGVAILNSMFEIMCIFPLYFIINYSIICFNQLKTRHLYSSEEIISMSITTSLIIAGTWGTAIQGVSIRNVVALTFILILGYVKGSASGAAGGVAMGTIIGVTSNDMMTYVSVYGLCGLISGLFRETGKWMSGAGYIIGFAVLKMYSNIGSQFKIIEVLISCIIYFGIPQSIYRKVELELDWQKKQEHLKENYADKIKSIFMHRLDSFSHVLNDISSVLSRLASNNKLTMKTKSSALIENLADRVCSNCDMNNMCWKRETFYTYNAFLELIQNYQENKKFIPEELQKKCTRRTLLLKNTKEIVNNYIVDEMWKSRLSECRELLAYQIGNMGKTVGEIVQDLNLDVRFNTSVENNIRRLLNKNNIKYKDVFCFKDKNEHLVINLSMEVCGGKQDCVKKILPLINNVTGKLMALSKDSCDINFSANSCSVTFEETPKYHIVTHVISQCKHGEKYNGDSYSFCKLPDGTYMTIISDGMGSGPQAGEESSAAVELIEKFAKSGFNKMTAINTVNSIMGIKFTEDEKFSTLDLSSINLYKGEIDFMKVGATASFIKRGEDILVIKSKTLPIGILDKPDIDIINKSVMNGDFIIMVSDGVIDYNSESAGNFIWMIEFLRKLDCTEPKDMCEKIMDKSKELSGGKVKDDMTVIVEKVYTLY
ncbi:stage II sporulation protein E [Clostridium kluyveri]|uniref:Predicted stage II sporulation protein E n=2 Tax=Clostridium kluyveri TaxID=1534 RepID=A5N4K2_CLOK5|nr:stage II sporulation protein E [Clostridium kluyveri]EDK32233.1 Predicted stage II sporulation protein E [Clostridium kluyveri DSM 555]